MHNKYDKAAAIIAVIIEAVLIFSAVTSIIQNNMKNIGLSLLTVVCITIPFIISFIVRRKKLLFPKSFNLVSVLFLFAALYLGEINTFYVKYMWWDLLLHAIFGFYAVITSLHAIQGVIRREIEISKNRYVMFSVLIAFSFAVTLGTIWEMFEFSGDFIFKSGMIKGGIEDTATDLLVKIAAAFITSAYYYLKNREA